MEDTSRAEVLAWRAGMDGIEALAIECQRIGLGESTARIVRLGFDIDTEDAEPRLLITASCAARSAKEIE